MRALLSIFSFLEWYHYLIVIAIPLLILVVNHAVNHCADDPDDEG